MDVLQANKALVEAARTNDLQEVSKLLANGADPLWNGSAALARAAANGHGECVKLLIPLSDPKADDCWALCWAADCGHAECVKLLLPATDPRGLDSAALCCSATKGHLECVKLLLPLSHPLVELGGLFEEVLSSGHADVAMLMVDNEPRLLDGVDLEQWVSKAIEKQRFDLARYLSSIIDKRQLSDIVGKRPACGSPRARI